MSGESIGIGVEVNSGPVFPSGGGDRSQPPASNVMSLNGRTGDVTLTKADITGTGLTPADIGAPPSSAFVPVIGAWFLDSYPGTDDQKMASALAAWAASTAGGTIVLPARTCTFSNQWVTAYQAGVTKYLGIKGAGFAANGLWQPVTAATVVEHDYQGTYKAEFLHMGTVEVYGLLWQDTSGGSTPFALCTNAQPQFHDMGFRGSKTGTACNQDAIVLGGTGTTVGGGETAPFQGYGGVVQRVFIDGIRRLGRGQTYCNGVVFRDNTVSITCGSNLAGDAPFVFTGIPSSACTANVVEANTVEMYNYAYLAAFYYSAACKAGPNGAFDIGSGTLGVYYLGANSTANTVIDGFRPGQIPLAVDVSGHNDLYSQQYGSETRYQAPYFGAGAYALSNGFRTVTSDGSTGYLSASPGQWPDSNVDIVSRSSSSYSDGVTNSTTTFTSATASFTSADIGSVISSAGNLPAGTRILALVNSTTVLLTKAATTSATGLTFYMQRDGGNGTLWTLISFRRNHIVTTGSRPTASAQAGAGGGASCTLSGTDSAGTVTLTTGTTPAAGMLLAIGMTNNYDGQPRVIWMPANAAAAAVNNEVYDGSTTANLELFATAALAGSTAYKWNYLVLQ